MANSITITGDKHNSRYFELVCTQKSNGSAKNSSTITWTLYAKGDSTHYSTGPTTVVINGKTVYSKERTSWETGKFPVAQGSVSGTTEVAHNADGKKTIAVKFSTAIYYKDVKEYSANWTLDSIPRYATITHSINATEETSVKVDWASDSTIDKLWYSTNNGDSWTWIADPNAKSGRYTITDLEPDMAYKIKTRVRRKDSQLPTDSKALDVTTYNFPHCVEAPDFTIGNPVKLKFYNPLHRSFQFRIDANGTMITHTWKESQTTYDGIYALYTGINADSTQTELYKTIPNSRYGTYEVVVAYPNFDVDDCISEMTWVNGQRYYIDTAKCTPVFNSFSYYDQKNVAGDDTIIVEKLSNLCVNISDSYKATPVNGARITHYMISCDTKQARADYSDDMISVTLGSILANGARRLSVRAYDSRGLSKEVYRDINVLAYSNPVVNVEAQRLNNFENQTTIRISGKYSSFGAGGMEKNGISGTVILGIYDSNGAMVNDGLIQPTYSGGSFTCPDFVCNLDNEKPFVVSVAVADLFNSTTVTADVGVGQSVLFVSSNKKACYINGVKAIMYDVVETWEGW